MTLHAVMPVFNEESRHLKDVLTHLMGIADEIFVYDDQSTDNTVKIVEDLGITVRVRNDAFPGFVQHEGRFRQSMWNTFQEVMKPQKDDWILAIDADEKLYKADERLDFAALLKQTDFDVLCITFFHMWNENEFRTDKAWRPHSSSRMFRYRLGGIFKDSPMASGSEPSFVQDLIRAGKYLNPSGLIMKHMGYQRQEDQKAKYERYMKLDGGDYHSLRHIESIMDESPELVEWKGIPLF